MSVVIGVLLIVATTLAIVLGGTLALYGVIALILKMLEVFVLLIDKMM